MQFTIKILFRYHIRPQHFIHPLGMISWVYRSAKLTCHQSKLFYFNYISLFKVLFKFYFTFKKIYQKFLSLGAVVVASTAAPKTDTRLAAYNAPVSGNKNLGIIRSEIKNGLRMVTICHDLKGKFGLKLKSIDNGIFVSLVTDGSTAAMVGIRYVGSRY